MMEKKRNYYMTILITLFPFERGEKKNTREKKKVYIYYRNKQ
jgi:hypothetical protein